MWSSGSPTTRSSSSWDFFIRRRMWSCSFCCAVRLANSDSRVRLNALKSRARRPRGRATIRVVKVVDAQYEHGVLRPLEQLNLRPGERVSIIVVWQPDPARWDLTKLATKNEEDILLAEKGLSKWSSGLEAEDNG